MKKFKTICSAIVAFTVLALAGCDMEVPDSEKVDIIPGLVMNGSGTASYGDSMTAYSKAMIGTWSISTYLDGALITSDESCTGDTWWSNNDQSTPVAFEDGSTVKIVATSKTESGEIFFECTDNTNYISVNPHKDAWGTGVTYSSYGSLTASVGTVVTFYATRKGNTVSFKAAAE
ncbi:hypothetical protein [Treponema sp.]|uniref:hypothetical protein n=1 Tax=Treponema sp. TaxID=166 RepID=UPI0025CE4DC7|nr:hypothetical protein [Treponema sp.]MBR4323797.1 hypothetical protein [Treponema sp.]